VAPHLSAVPNSAWISMHARLLQSYLPAIVVGFQVWAALAVVAVLPASPAIVDSLIGQFEATDRGRRGAGCSVPRLSRFENCRWPDKELSV
jgi:hypothetical protein